MGVYHMLVTYLTRGAPKCDVIYCDIPNISVGGNSSFLQHTLSGSLLDLLSFQKGEKCNKKLTHIEVIGSIFSKSATP
jgi:hypothetical protein